MYNLFALKALAGYNLINKGIMCEVKSYGKNEDSQRASPD
jgi:hypothetical protein